MDDPHPIAVASKEEMSPNVSLFTSIFLFCFMCLLSCKNENNDWGGGGGGGGAKRGWTVFVSRI